MAGNAIGWNSKGSMIGICTLVIVVGVAAIAGVGRGIIIPVVTAGAVVGYNRMSSCKRVIIFMNWESGRLPAGCGCMAGRASGRNIRSSMVGITCLIICCNMTIAANSGRTGIAIGVATQAIK